MSDVLHALAGGKRMGVLSYRDDRLRFTYEEQWQGDPAAFPLSLSMPLHTVEHGDAVVRPFVTGLLPDDAEVLRRWGQQFQVSAGNPFRLLEHVGEECAGAIQFVNADKVDRWVSDDSPAGVDWLSENELAERIQGLVKDRSRARRIGDEGHFSLAGAQPKTGLYRDEAKARWGIPKGVTPTTHILKPSLGEFDAYEENEHFCLRLAGAIGLPAARSWTESIGGIPTIIVERFDRVRRGDVVIRVHQEDMCQALARMPNAKYENEGGPSAQEIIGLIRRESSKDEEDVLRFLDAQIFNYLIAGTDAHAKNYGFLLAGGRQVRLSRLYDVSSSLPYPNDIQPRKARLAMKVGGTYLLWKIGPRQWEKAAGEWGLERDLVFGRIRDLAGKVQEAASDVRKEVGEVSKDAENILDLLVEELLKNAGATVKLFAKS